jgi:hypothetical protein
MFGFLKPHIRPLQKPHPPIGVAGLSKNSDTLKLAGERGFLPLSLNLNPAYVAQPLGRGGGSARPHRPHAEPRRLALVREVFVAETDAEAWKLSVGGMMGRMMREYFLPLLGNFGFLEYLKHDPDVPDSDVTPEYCAKHNWLVGSPATVAEKLERIYHESAASAVAGVRLRLHRQPAGLAQFVARVRSLLAQEAPGGCRRVGLKAHLTTARWSSHRMSRVLHRSGAIPPVAVSGEGIYLHLADGRAMIDASGGAAVACLGHGNRRVAEAIGRQAFDHGLRPHRNVHPTSRPRTWPTSSCMTSRAG